MVYLYIGKNTIKLISLSKTLLGQYNVSFFEKTHTTNLLSGGAVKNVDIVASAVKEALTSAQPTAVKDTDIYLVLPQDAFIFARYPVPSDIQQGAIVPFIKDKARADVAVDLDSAFYDYLLLKDQQESTVLFFAQKHTTFQTYNDAMKLLGLTVKAVVPETVCYFKLFEKTLKKDKKETILFVSQEEKGSFGYLFDSLGLVKKDQLNFTEPIEKSLKERVEKYKTAGTKIDRIIISGNQSTSVRQDTFTKNVGAWTNLMEKIVTTFYQEYLKLIIPPDKSTFPFLSYDVCLGAFILHRENTPFSIYKASGFVSSQKRLPSGKFSLGLPSIKIRDVGIFLVSMIISFTIISFFQGKLGKGGLGSIALIKTPTPTATPTTIPSPTTEPTPSFDKDTLKIKILNGSGKVGKAGEIKDLLKEKGYVDILTGNADNYDYTKTQIQVKETKKEAAELIKKDLSDVIKITDVSTLDEKDPADLILIFGADFQ